MRKWAKGAAGATLLTASFVAFGAVPALADGTNGDGSILGGNQIDAPISVPVNISGNAVGALGHAMAGSRGGSAVYGASRLAGGHRHTSGAFSVGGGNQINAPITAPINACGNAVGVIGGALAGCAGGSAAGAPGGYRVAGHHARTSGRHSVLGGNQVNAPINAPVNVCGNTAAVLGDALAGCRGGAGVGGPGLYQAGGFGGRTSGFGSIGGGNQVHAPVNAPINVCGNAVGNALAGCRGGALVGAPGGYQGYGYGHHHHTSGAFSIGGGNQVHAPVNAPVDVCGNAAAVLGRALAGCEGALPGAGAYGAPAGYFHGHTSGFGSIGGGNQVYAPITAPVDACGNAAAVVGHALGACGATSGGYGEDCVTPYSARMSGLPQLPVDAASMRKGALPVAMGATPALPQLPGRTLPQSAGRPGPLGGGLSVPVVGDATKQLPPLGLTSADTSTSASNGALAALALGGLFAASAGTISVARRLNRRSGR
jgi:hypothetical protein